MNLPDLALVEKTAEPEINDAERVKELIEKRTIASTKDLRYSVQWLAEIKNQAAAVKAQQKSFTGPLKEVIKRIDNFFKPAIAALEMAEKMLKDKVVLFSKNQVTLRNDALDQVENEPDESKRAALVQQSEEYVLDKIPGLSIREKWEGSIANQGKLLEWCLENKREFVQVDTKQLNKLTSSFGKDPQIPGWKAEKKTTVVITPSRV